MKVSELKHLLADADPEADVVFERWIGSGEPEGITHSVDMTCISRANNLVYLVHLQLNPNTAIHSVAKNIRSKGK